MSAALTRLAELNAMRSTKMRIDAKRREVIPQDCPSDTTMISAVSLKRNNSCNAGPAPDNVGLKFRLLLKLKQDP
jgi:hypothetical protein